MVDDSLYPDKQQAWSVPKPPLAILDFYGAKDFNDPFWTIPNDKMLSKLPPVPPRSAYSRLFEETVCFQGGLSLEGQTVQGPNLQDPRQAFAMYSIASGNLLQAIWPRAPQDIHLIDPIQNVHPKWPPTAFVHGVEDDMIPITLSKRMENKLKECGIETAFFEVEGEGHTFCGKMSVGTETWYSQRRGFDWLEGILKRRDGEW